MSHAVTRRLARLASSCSPVQCMAAQLGLRLPRAHVAVADAVSERTLKIRGDLQLGLRLPRAHAADAVSERTLKLRRDLPGAAGWRAESSEIVYGKWQVGNGAVQSRQIWRQLLFPPNAGSKSPRALALELGRVHTTVPQA